jgi:hypothetical protein
MDTTYARLLDGTLIKATKGVDKNISFFCAGCGDELYAATEGNKQYPHFRHKTLSTGNKKGCGNPEHYIHWITKELFADYYRKTDCFLIEIPITRCCEKSGKCRTESKHVVDLKKIYPHILVEAYDQNFKPDCMLHNDTKEVLYLEVKYTHAVSLDKINSGVPIIEISVSTEKDIDKIIADGSIKVDGEIHKIYNESVLLPKKLTFDCKGKCSPKPTHKPSSKPVIQHKISYMSPEKSYWGAINASWAAWKRGLSGKEETEKSERPDYRSRQYKDD